LFNADLKLKFVAGAATPEELSFQFYMLFPVELVVKYWAEFQTHKDQVEGFIPLEVAEALMEETWTQRHQQELKDAIAELSTNTQGNLYNQSGGEVCLPESPLEN